VTGTGPQCGCDPPQSLVNLTPHDVVLDLGAGNQLRIPAPGWCRVLPYTRTGWRRFTSSILLSLLSGHGPDDVDHGFDATDVNAHEDIDPDTINHVP